VSKKTNDWFFNGLAAETQESICFNRREGQSATYDQLAVSNIRLASYLINAKGFTDVTVSFDWQKREEVETRFDNVLYDYGAFVYSFDGVNFTTVEVHSSSYREGHLVPMVKSHRFR
jgi:hypothetical protein